MKNNRRKFLKITGLAGLSLAPFSFIPGCTSGSSEKEVSTAGKTGDTAARDWQSDPEWIKVKYGPWGGPGISSETKGPMDDVLLKDYAPKPTVVTPVTSIPKAKYPPIDVHIHRYPERVEGRGPEEVLAEWVRTMDEVGIEKSVILTEAIGEEFDKMVALYLELYPDRFQLYCGLDMSDIEASDYPERAARHLEECYQKGARGVGEITDKGFGITEDTSLSPEQRMHPHDPRLDAVWQKCAELNMPVNLHVADHPSAWRPPDVYQERTPIYQQFNRYGGPGNTYDELVTMGDKTLERNPETKFIFCHLKNQGNDLGTLSEKLDKYPNLYLDIAARDYEVGRTPRAAKQFLTKYSDRVMFGTDMGMDKSMYQSWWRLLESADEYMTGRVWWMYYGLDLPDSVLEALYRKNAQRILNWERV